MAGDAPDWLRAQLSAPLPPHDDKTVAVLLYTETVLTVQNGGHLKRLERRAYRILRPEGEALGLVRLSFDAQSRITALRGWCIPAAGKVYAVREKDAFESALNGVEDGILMSDEQTKSLQIPAALPGNLIGYEYEQDQRPYVTADEWDIQETVPVREAHYTLQLPPGWDYQSVWVNSEQLPASAAGVGQWSWLVNNIEAIRLEPQMPPWRGIGRRMVVSLFPPAGQTQGFRSWSDLGMWYLNLARDRRVASPELTQKVSALTAGIPAVLGRMQALAAFVQNDIRYVAIEIGIGGQQPHAASAVFSNRFGDCKDKATLLSTMLKQIGIDSFYVAINTTRGSIAASTPPNIGFNHMILAIQLPADLGDPALRATMKHARLGTLLFFDPTDNLTPFGSLRGELQANFGLLETAEGGELLALPQLRSDANSLQRTARMILDDKGVLRGDIHERLTGDAAADQRYALRSTTHDTDRIKPVEAVAAASLTTYSILKATIANLRDTSQPFEWNYSLEAENYAKVAGGLIMLRPRILGTKGSALLETEEPRHYPVEFEGPLRDTDDFSIALPAGYEVDDLPPAVNVDYGFANYQSQTSVADRTLHYSRTFEIKQLSVPVDKTGDLKKLYRVIANDERQMAVLKAVSP